MRRFFLCCYKKSPLNSQLTRRRGLNNANLFCLLLRPLTFLLLNYNLKLVEEAFFYDLKSEMLSTKVELDSALEYPPNEQGKHLKVSRKWWVELRSSSSTLDIVVIGYLMKPNEPAINVHEEKFTANQEISLRNLQVYLILEEEEKVN